MSRVWVSLVRIPHFIGQVKIFPLCSDIEPLEIWFGIPDGLGYSRPNPSRIRTKPKYIGSVRNYLVFLLENSRRFKISFRISD